MSLADKLIEIERNVPKVYEAGHKDGYSKGFSSGSEVGYGEGYTEGYSAGYDEGYAEGFSEGENSGWYAGYDLGMTEGQETGYRVGHREGVEAGKQSANEALWDAILMNGNRTDYYRAFAFTSYTPKTFLPNHDIRPVGNAQEIFRCASPATANEDDYVDMVELEERMGIVFDFSQATSLYAAFASSPFKRINRVDLSGIGGSYQTHYMFYPAYEAQMLKRIEHLIFPSTLTAVEATMFKLCRNLEHIGFEGTFAVSNMTLADCLVLDKETFVKLFTAMSTTTSGLSVTLSLAAVNKAFEIAGGDNNGSISTEWAALVNTRPNWTINLV